MWSLRPRSEPTFELGAVDFSLKRTGEEKTALSEPVQTNLADRQ